MKTNTIYFFAETPRAASDHPAVVPCNTGIPAAERNRCIEKCRKRPVTAESDFIGVSQPAERIRLGAAVMSTETLVLAVPGCDLQQLPSPQQQRIVQKLKQFLLQMKDVHDWQSEKRSVVPLPQFDVWQNELAKLLPQRLPLLPPAASPPPALQKGKFFMRPQFLYIILAVLTLLALLVLYLAISPLMERPAIVAAAEISGKAQNLQQWLDAVGEDYTSFGGWFIIFGWRSKTMEEYEQHLQRTLKKKVDAAQYGQWISGRQRELEECLGDDGLRTKVAALFSNGQLNEYAFVDRKDEKTPWFVPPAALNAPFPPEEPTMEKTRKTLHAAVDVYNTMQEKFFQDNDRRRKNDKWIRFAANLDFAHEGQNLAEMFTCVQDAPFVTPTEIEMTHCIYKWLTGEDASTVGIRDVGNYNDAMQKFADISIEWEKYSPYGKKTGDSIPDNELAPEDRTLKQALKALQQSVLPRTEYDTDRK